MFLRRLFLSNRILIVTYGCFFFLHGAVYLTKDRQPTGRARVRPPGVLAAAAALRRATAAGRRDAASAAAVSSAQDDERQSLPQPRRRTRAAAAPAAARRSVPAPSAALCAPDYDSPALMDQIRLMVRDAVRDVLPDGSAAATAAAVVSSAPPSASSAGAPAVVPAVACAAPQADVPIFVTSIGPHAGINPVGSDGTVPISH